MAERNVEIVRIQGYMDRAAALAAVGLTQDIQRFTR